MSVRLLTNWFIATRPWSFTMTLISVSVGSALAALDGSFSWGLCLLAAAGAVFMHAGTNLLNDYYDVKHGLDTLFSATAQYRPHAIVHGLLPAEQVFRAACGLFAAASLIGVYLAFASGWMVLLIGLVGVLAGIGYTAPPMKYKYLALGEVSVFLMWGPLMIEGAYYVQTHVLSFQAFLISIPFGLLVALTIFANNIRDIDHDSSRNIRTLAIWLGPDRGVRAYLLLMALAYVSTLFLTLSNMLSLWGLLVFLSLPLAVQLQRRMARGIPQDADAMTAKLDTAFGVLLVAALIIQGLGG
ncbi:MAG: 1,4-dihydroxy-2-naphthoate octaprenyltransferase [Deltaproteobacteria bacterium ADurb.BinA179]|jgi:1,4-dihydroxy-2-naphthoate octaprenyltransferase|nr:1,4-dihydroxy-2-naphthoate octaprenyltransferase [Deltaproteobacteria bacterium]MDI9543491.1 1,4-dihydroxy-2-naphthoate octaprenyltransferase [Pseudomonadota bacterium]OPZ28677.1 MAG: 1,4-dihydroxy-2-naphthoate octaprenyltransferase [Deltaproteobacteria bacterium ADurb.BinA179]HRR69791.1 1,4-dihydroxy-2-naphthoate octaprenyltransferase [Desulfomonilia bacterium]HNU73510.1 1,4-dihydroxy-2-naphthoate octaprenyltransferase [Deltaproteobacteria bacterium]